jgi:hypothetical protein
MLGQVARGQHLSDQLSDNRREHGRTSAYTHVPASAGQLQVFAGNFAREHAWGSRGRGFKSRRPDWSDGFFGPSFGSQLGSQWFPGAGAGQLGGVRLQDAVHGGGVIDEGGPDLVTVDRLGDRCAGVPDQVADVSRRTSWALRIDTNECRSSQGVHASPGRSALAISTFDSSVLLTCFTAAMLTGPDRSGSASRCPGCRTPGCRPGPDWACP